MRLLRSDVPSLAETSGEYASLYRKERHYADTADGWTLCLTRYKPVSQPFPQPMLGEPILMVHGFSQNRHAWTSGDFVKQMLLYGADVYLLELRGHGLSSRALQLKRRRETGRALPEDFDYGWDVDSYFLHDVPAAVAAVKRVSGRRRVFYCGHSMGGMVGYGYAASTDDLAGLVTIGAPSDLGRGFVPIRLLARTDGALKIAEAAANTITFSRKAAFAARWAWAKVARRGPVDPPAAFAIRYVPTDALLRLVGREIEARHGLYKRLGEVLPFLGNLERVAKEDIQWLLAEGGEREPFGVVRQFARWIRDDELVCYRTGFDFKANFHRIEIPLAILYGDLDRLASEVSTRTIYFRARSAYRVRKPVRGNSHVELTMGRDVREIAEEVRNLVLHATERRFEQPTAAAE